MIVTPQLQKAAMMRMANKEQAGRQLLWKQPHRSNRSLAKEIGVDIRTVRRWRISLENQNPSFPRVRRNGNSPPYELGVGDADARGPSPCGDEQARRAAAFVIAEQRRTGRPPTVREVGDACGVRSSNTTLNHLRHAVAMGLLENPGGSVARGYSAPIRDGYCAACGRPLEDAS